MDEEAAPSILFAGRTWRVKTSADRVGPGQNLFAAENVVVDPAGRLHLSIARTSQEWTCAEVIGQGDFGYGTYRWSLASTVTDLEAPVVLGLFTWSDQKAQANRELDIEFSRWGDPTASVRGGFTLQREAAPPEGVSFPVARRPSQHTLEWSPGRLRFRSTFGQTWCEWGYDGQGVPTPGGNVAPRMNLWLFQGRAPTNPHSIIVDDFAYAGR